jgi:CheY-like chemotaxis protein
MTATVLLVEDERKLRELVRSYLERAGFMVLSTGSGAEAISLAGSADPDLVVLDLGLPDVPGETVAREIRAAGATPILMLTAKSAEDDRIAGLELGADDLDRPESDRDSVLPRSCCLGGSVSSTVTRRRLARPVDDLSVLFLPNICSPWWCVFVPPAAAAARVALRGWASPRRAAPVVPPVPRTGQGGRLRPRMRRRRRP